MFFSLLIRPWVLDKVLEKELALTWKDQVSKYLHNTWQMQNKAMELFPCLESSGAELLDSTPVHGVPGLPLMVSLLLRNLSFPFSPASILYPTQICMLPPHPCPEGDLILITIHAFFACDYLLERLFSSSESVLPPYKPCLPFNFSKKIFPREP